MTVLIVSDRLLRMASMTVQMGQQSYQDNGSAKRVLSAAEIGITDRSDGPAFISG
ncbi:hypothetical protein DPMN_072531 [Dreissena polymorpha]|uniref:Uncharacterized protein n=1 Tax=Dreissena polymorpha TaxID=45954 RepID=A0A9D4BWV0_DREPO|nr:hypothetical protein DPMN_072531 [Dreissena polymorpha]